MSDSARYEVVFGLGGAWGFAPGDLTSPAQAAGAGAFTDDRLPPYEPDFTELRVHGVSGSSGLVMLEHPAALQVAGDGMTMFYRRWTPAGAGGAGVPWKLEAYSWGGLTESPLASASWLLFAPFMLYNLAQFARPPQKEYQVQPVRQTAAPAAAPGILGSSSGQAGGNKAKDADRALLGRDAGHGWAAALLRLLAFSATLQFTIVIVSILVNSAGMQAPNAHLPSWLLWYPQWQAGGRVALVLAGVAVVIALIWLISVKTAQRYEARTSRARPAVNKGWPLTQTQFWMGQELVQRQRSLHIGGALAITALIVARPGPHIGGGRLALLTGSALMLALIAVTLCRRLADRHTVTLAEDRIPAGSGKRKDTRGTLWCRLLLAGGAVVFAGAFFTSGWPAEKKKAPISLPGFTNTCAFLLAAQALLLVALALTVWKLTRSAPEPDTATRPFGAGHLTTIFAVLAVCLGGVFSAVTALFATRVIGTPVPSGIRFSPRLVRWP